MTFDFDGAERSIEKALAQYVPGGMIGDWLLGVEIYDHDGEAELLQIGNSEGTLWKHLGIADHMHASTRSHIQKAE